MDGKRQAGESNKTNCLFIERSVESENGWHRMESLERVRETTLEWAGGKWVVLGARPFAVCPMPIQFTIQKKKGAFRMDIFVVAALVGLTISLSSELFPSQPTHTHPHTHVTTHLSFLLLHIIKT